MDFSTWFNGILIGMVIFGALGVLWKLAVISMLAREDRFPRGGRAAGPGSLDLLDPLDREGDSLPHADTHRA